MSVFVSVSVSDNVLFFCHIFMLGKQTSFFWENSKSYLPSGCDFKLPGSHTIKFSGVFYEVSYSINLKRFKGADIRPTLVCFF